MFKCTDNYNTALAVRLVNASKKCKTLFNRLDEAITNGIVENGRYVDGIDDRFDYGSFREMFFSDQQYADVMSALAKRYGHTSHKAEVESNFNKVAGTIMQYFNGCASGAYTLYKPTMIPMKAMCEVVCDDLYDIAVDILDKNIL